MADKYIKISSSGFLQEQEVITQSSGAGDAGKLVGLDSTGKLDQSLMPVGIGADTKVIQASENLSAGDFVNVWNDSGTVKVRKADASAGVSKKADGFVLSAVSSGNNATVYFEGTNTQLSGLTGGSNYFLSTTAGGATTTPPTTSGYIVQYLGKALSSSEISFEPGEPIIRG